MRQVLIIIILLLLSSPAHAESKWFSWDETNTKLHVPLILTLYVDMKTTEWHINNGSQDGCYYEESNAYLGKHPTIEETREYFALVSVGITGIVWILPPTPSYIFQGGVISFQLYTIKGNIAAGAEFKF